MLSTPSSFRPPWALALLAALAAAPAQGAGALVRLPEDAVLPIGARAVTFGLTDAQRAGVHALTAGRVDLRRFFHVRAQGREALAALPGFQGALGPALSPLAVVGPEGRVRGDVRSWSESEFALGAQGLAGLADPALAGLWWLTDLGAEAAWAVSTGLGVTIADCDTGFYTEESDLQPNLRVDLGRDYSDADDPKNVANGRLVFHGTAVAAIMTGARDGRGTNGIAYDARLVPLQNYNYDKTIDDLEKEESTARCILGALSVPEVSVIVVQNQTAQGSSETYAGTREAIRLAVQAGVTVVSAAGNASVELLTEAKDDTGSIIVGAVRQTGRMANFSNFGKRVTVAAYGENLHTLYGPQGRMDTFGGTTGATAQVGATVALMLSANPGLSPAQVREILEKTRRTDLSNDRVGGRLDILRAVISARDTEPDRDWRIRADALRHELRALLARPDGEATP